MPDVPGVQLIPIGPNVDRAPGDPAERAAQARDRWHVPAGVPLIVFFGFLHPLKGLEYLIRAMPHVCGEHAGARLVLAGGWRSLALPGAEGDAYHGRLQSMILESNLGDVVTITGYLPEV